MIELSSGHESKQEESGIEQREAVVVTMLG